ncbi:hypothetical protein KEM56_004732 [Ascosphaera pollenicola]|nr:hypothetical protein KEM56_004732 [Ascosphaera pollenicola]
MQLEAVRLNRPDRCAASSSEIKTEQRAKLCPAIEEIVRTEACPSVDLAVLSVEEQIGLSQSELGATFQLWLTDGVLKIRAMIHEAHTKPPQKDTVICLQDYQLQRSGQIVFLAVKRFEHMGQIETRKRKVDDAEATPPRPQLSGQVQQNIAPIARATTGLPPTPLNLWTLRDLVTQKSGTYDFVCDVLAIVVWLSPVKATRLGTKRDMLLVDHTWPKSPSEKAVLLSTFVAPQSFNPPVGTIGLFRGLKTHKYQGLSLNSYKEDNEGKEWFITDEEKLRSFGPAIDVDRLRQVWQERCKRGRQFSLDRQRSKMSNQPGSNPPTSGIPPTQQRPPPPLVRVRRQKADPLVRPKKRLPPRPPQDPAIAGLNSHPAAPAPAPAPQPPAPAASVPPRTVVPPLPETAVNGFTGPPLSDVVTDYPVVTTKRALLEGLRHHVARFTSKKNIDPRDESQFVRPVRLQRRDPRATQEEIVPEKPKPVKGQLANLTEAEREELEARKLAKEKEREESLAQIAPSVASTQKRANPPKQRTQQVFKAEMTPQEIARARVKYEEALPWHLEDFENKSTWVGNYEAAMSETYVMFVPRRDRKMSMIPLDKWYKFTAKKNFKHMSLEEAEKQMAKTTKEPVWLSQKIEKDSEPKEKRGGLYTGKHDVGGNVFEADELDFEEDRFADDEERPDLFEEEDEDTKIAEERIKKDQLKANIFNLKTEEVYDEEEMKEKLEKEAFRHYGKQVQKALQRREKNYDYSSGSEENPYEESSSSESGDEQEDLLKPDEQQRQDTEAEGAVGATAKDTSRQKTSGQKKEAGSSASARKRLGSPGLSDASGTDTSRKNKKKNANAAQTSARPMSPSTQASGTVSKKRARSGLGSPSGSDVERGATPGGDVSDMGSKKLKFSPPGQRSPISGTPLPSRAASPAPPVSRTGSVGAQGAPSAPASPLLPFPTPAEVHAAIPASGISSAELLRVFRSRLGDSKQNQARFITVVKGVSVYGKDKLLRPNAVKPQ